MCYKKLFILVKILWTIKNLLKNTKKNFNAKIKIIHAKKENKHNNFPKNCPFHFFGHFWGLIRVSGASNLILILRKLYSLETFQEIIIIFRKLRSRSVNIIFSKTKTFFFGFTGFHSPRLSARPSILVFFT